MRKRGPVDEEHVGISLGRSVAEIGFSSPTVGTAGREAAHLLLIKPAAGTLSVAVSGSGLG